MFVLPDPYVAEYSADTVAAQATDGTLATALAAVEGVSAFGTMAAITTATVTETAVDLGAGGVTATTSATAVTLAGETTAAGYVVCWMEKEGTSSAPVEEAAGRLLQEAEAAATESTAAAETTEAAAESTAAAAETTAAAAVEDSFDEAAFMAANNFQRAATTAEDLTWTLSFASSEGMVYDWGCQATSMHPSNP